MRWTGEEPVISAAFNEAARKPESKAKPRKSRKRRETSVVTLRVTTAERARLKELAAGMTLLAYIRACVFAEEEKRRKKRPKDAVADKKALAECLALLGHSKMASNLNQLAYQANIGALVLDIDTKSEISEAYEAILEMRALLITALKAWSDDLGGKCAGLKMPKSCSPRPKHRNCPSISKIVIFIKMPWLILFLRRDGNAMRLRQRNKNAFAKKPSHAMPVCRAVWLWSGRRYPVRMGGW